MRSFRRPKRTKRPRGAEKSFYGEDDRAEAERQNSLRERVRCEMIRTSYGR